MVEAETQTDRLITTPLEVLAVSCITYKMIDSIRTAVNQAEHDLATLLFRLHFILWEFVITLYGIFAESLSVFFSCARCNSLRHCWNE